MSAELESGMGWRMESEDAPTSLVHWVEGNRSVEQEGEVTSKSLQSSPGGPLFGC